MLVRRESEDLHPRLHHVKHLRLKLGHGRDADAGGAPEDQIGGDHRAAFGSSCEREPCGALNRLIGGIEEVLLQPDHLMGIEVNADAVWNREITLARLGDENRRGKPCKCLMALHHRWAPLVPSWGR